MQLTQNLRKCIYIYSEPKQVKSFQYDIIDVLFRARYRVSTNKRKTIRCCEKLPQLKSHFKPYLRVAVFNKLIELLRNKRRHFGLVE